ncbi:MAG: hypothetical protein M1828_006152 [Chrysothrix sp. TS-e1954]|nr:MAG: hypothetical protein M1828_006152 [Chrysothrix sp. TS-e1954]
MCVHRLLIFTTCGHFHIPPVPVLPCNYSRHFTVDPPAVDPREALRNTLIPPRNSIVPKRRLPANASLPKPPACRPIVHPFVSRAINTLCYHCAREESAEQRIRQADLERRKHRLQGVLEDGWLKDVRVEDWKWKVKISVRGDSQGAGRVPVDMKLGSQL